MRVMTRLTVTLTSRDPEVTSMTREEVLATRGTEVTTLLFESSNAALLNALSELFN